MHLSKWQEVVEIDAVIKNENRKKAKCPYCGRYINVFQAEDASCRGIFLKCKNKKCGKVFELKI